MDTWEGTPNDETGDLLKRNPSWDPLGTFCQNMGVDLFRQVYPLRGTSLFWARLWQQRADLVFVDGDHSYEACRADIKAWWPHVRPGGVLAVHDYGVLHTVTRAVDELMPGHQLAGRTVAWVRR